MTDKIEYKKNKRPTVFLNGEQLSTEDIVYIGVGDKQVKLDNSKLNDNSSLYLIDHGFQLKKSPRLRLHFKSYKTFEGKNNSLLEKVNDGSIITRFDKTPYPQ